MRELSNNPSQGKEKQEVVAKQEKELTFWGSKRIPNGHSIWELTPSGEIRTAAIIDDAVVDLEGNRKSRKKLVIDDACKYVIALNEKNAIKKFKRNGWV